MASPDLSRTPDKRVLGYRFAGVVLDLRRQALVVDGEDVASTPLSLRLLQVLCEADGQLVKRQALFDALWPGGQEVSDASLSQLVWRLRGTLGAYGGLIATVRRGGLRLDAAVSTELDFQRVPRKPAAEHETESPRAVRLVDSAPPSTVVADAVPVLRERRVMAKSLAGIAVLIALVAAAWQWWPRDALVSDGYALAASDLQASGSATVALVTAAFNAENTGERSRAQALMQNAHETDSTTPLPAVMLAWWSADAAPEQARTWLDAARARITPATSPYLRLFAEYFAARTRGDSFRGPLNAALDLRPQAWYLQYSSAHDQLGNRELAGALRSLQRIPLDGADGDLAAHVVADRVALGDQTAVVLGTQLKSITTDPALADYARGRLAYSRGDLRAAIAAFDEGRDAASAEREYSLQQQASALGAFAALEAGDTDAAARVDASLRLCHEQGEASCEVDMLGFAALLAARAGQVERADTTLAEAWARNRNDFQQPPLLLVALENGLRPPGDVAAVARSQSGGSVFGGVADLLLGWDAYARGERERAGQQLALAREHGIAGTYHAEDARLLGARLGESPTPCRVDPPYPNRLRLGACIALADAAKP